MSHNLADILQQLPDSGPSGFEGLIAALLSHLTGRQFHLAQSGTQEGRDISSRHTNANVIAVECKRYRSGTGLKKRELLGEIVEVLIDIPDLDIWVLVASRDVPSRLHEALHRATSDRGVELFIISDGDASPSSLEVLCAHAPALVAAHVAQHLPVDVPRLQQILTEIAATPDFADRVAQLRSTLLTPLLGYDNWRVEQNQWLTRCFQSESEAHAHFGQLLNVAQQDVQLIARHAAWQELDLWFRSWKDTHRPLAVLGEEGDGKTWAVASWVHRKTAHDTQWPPVVFISSADIDTNEPLDMIVHAVAQRSPTLSKEQVRKRVQHWLQKSNVDDPLFLLVLDGINERYEVNWWRALLEKLRAEPWCNSIAVIITCRTGYWQQFASLRSVTAALYTIEPYDDQELDTALVAHGLHRSDIQLDLLPLARKPRYFDLLVQHRTRVAESGDFTVARLIYEDWRDRLARKRNFALDDNNFQNLLRELVRKYLEGEKSIRPNQLVEFVSFPDRQVVEELRTSGVFREHHGRYEVQKPHLVLGLALLLVEEVEDATQHGRDITETIASWLEPHAAMDIKAQICEAAALRALELPDLARSAKTGLLRAWLTSQNVGQTAATNVSAYFPIDPASYFELAEIIWSDAVDHTWGQKVLMHTFLHWITRQEVAHLPLWQEVCMRWLSFVHRFGSPYQRDMTDPEHHKIQRAIEERVGSALPLGQFSLAGYQFTVIDDDGLLALGRVALALVSHIPRASFTHAIAVGCVAEAIMGRPGKYDEFAWVIRTSPQPVWNEVRSEVTHLLATNNHLAQEAAYHLLSFVGNAEAYQLQETLPNDLFPPHSLREHHQSDPCVSGLSWSRRECEQCVSRTDISASWIARQIKRYCIDPHLPVPEDIGQRLAPLAETIDVQSMHIVLAHTSADHAFEEYEPSLCAYASQELASVVRRLVLHIAERKGLPLRQLSLFLKQDSLICQQVEHDAIYQAWSKLRINNAGNEHAEVAEEFLFPQVLRPLDAQHQLTLLWNRPEQAPDLLRCEYYFQPLADWGTAWHYLATARNANTVFRVLWFLSVHATAIPPVDVETKILPLLTHDNTRVRGRVLRVILAAQAQRALELVVGGSWTWHASYNDEENHWGSLVLSEHGQQLSFADITRRVYPAYIGYAVQCRGNKTDEVEAYAQIWHRQWLHLGADPTDVPIDAPPIALETSPIDDSVTHLHRRRLADNADPPSLIISRATWGGEDEVSVSDVQDMLGGSEEMEQRWNEGRREGGERFIEAIEQQIDAGNHWFAHRFFPDAFQQVWQVRPDLVKQWVTNALSEQTDGQRRLQRGSTFYEALCEMLLQNDPEQGLQLYWQLHTTPLYVFTQDSNTNIRLIDYALFRAHPTAEIQAAWQQRLERCTSDQELLRMVIAAQAGQAQDWLWSYIKQTVDSDEPLAHMRAITLLGLFDAEESAQQLTELRSQLPDTWMRDLVDASLERWQRNSWAKHWFRRFLTVQDNVEAWAAFRLLLRCVDQRFWLWHPQIVAEVGNDVMPSNRAPFLEDNLDDIERNARKNQDSFEKHFLGHKVKHRQLWPWML